MTQFNWSILVDAADLELVLVVLEIPHHNCLLKKDVSTIPPFCTQVRFVTKILVDSC